MVTHYKVRGLQPERTSIAWLRTGLALMVNAMLIAREGLLARSNGTLLLLLSTVICFGYVFAHVIRRHKIKRDGERKFILPLAEARIVSLLVALVGVLIAFTPID